MQLPPCLSAQSPCGIGIAKYTEVFALDLEDSQSEEAQFDHNLNCADYVVKNTFVHVDTTSPYDEDRISARSAPPCLSEIAEGQVTPAPCNSQCDDPVVADSGQRMSRSTLDGSYVPVSACHVVSDVFARRDARFEESTRRLLESFRRDINEIDESSLPT